MRQKLLKWDEENVLESCLVPGQLAPLSTDPAAPLSPAVGPSEAEPSWAGIPGFVTQSIDSSDILGMISDGFTPYLHHGPGCCWKSLCCPSPLYLVHLPMAQPSVTHWDQILPGILGLLTLCQSVPALPWDLTQQFLRMLLLFLPCPGSDKTLPTSQIFPKAGISRQCCSK